MREVYSCFSFNIFHCIVLYLPHARTTEATQTTVLSNTRLLQENNGFMQPVSRQRLGEHVRMRNSGNCLSGLI
jgi:hypothetical protein